MSDEMRKIREILEQHENRIRALEGGHREKPTGRKSQSIKEFMLEKKPGNDVLKTLVVAYFAEIRDKVSPFNLKDLEGGFREAKEPLPGNLSDKVAKNIRKGHMMESKEKKDGFDSWTLTSTGERFVENGLKDEK
jgi:hypothetical protein